MAFKVKFRTLFPALVSADSPLTLVKTGLSYVFGLDIAALRQSLDPVYLITNLTNLILSGSTSGTVTVKAPAVAGSNIVTLPAATDTLVGKATTDTLTNKTLGGLTAQLGTNSAGGGLRYYAANATDYTELYKGAGIGNATTDAINFYSSFAAAIVASIDRNGRAQFKGGLFSSGPTEGIGYSAGAGGTVTQATSKATTVALNTVSGQITMNNAALAAGTIISFIFTNSAIAATDVLILNHNSGGTPGSYTLNASCGGGGATIYVRNNTAGSLSEAIVIQFALVKAANS